MAIAGAWIPSGNDQARLTSQLRSAVQSLNQAVQQLTSVSNIMTQMNASGTAYVNIETYFSVQSGSGQAVNDIVGSAASDLQGSTIQALIQKLG